MHRTTPKPAEALILNVPYLSAIHASDLSARPFLVIALASYQFGQVGARQVPYAYFLLGLTTLTIATDGVTAPAQAWQIGLDRSEEILA